jgi:hypothetical protein
MLEAIIKKKTIARGLFQHPTSKSIPVLSDRHNSPWALLSHQYGLIPH